MLVIWTPVIGINKDTHSSLTAKQLRNENTKLRRLVADLSLDKEALQPVIRKTGWSS
jgi:hypothetical protein